MGAGAVSVAMPLPLCAALVALVFAVGTAAGGYVGRLPLHTELAQLRTTHAETDRVAALAAAKGLQQAQQRGDALTTTLVQRQAQINQLQKDKRDALNRLTTGRACLGAAAVRVLNQPASPADAGPEPVPTAPGDAAAAGAAFATDADVGHWAIAARAAHDTCRQRLDALIDWHSFQPQHTSAP